MTEVVVSSSKRQLPPSTTLSRPLTHSAMTTRSAGAARQHGSETSPPTTAFASASAAATSSAPAPAPAGPPSLPALTTTTSSAPGSTSSRHAAPPHPLQTSSSSPLRGPMTRKRAASIIADDPGHPRIEDLSLNTPSTAGVVTPTTRDLICLCTPAPKIPRPRNAFILYRQAHQTQVKLQNKNLPNPEISKIIGERWRDEPEEEKSQWKQLAEEEKLRHQRQYPDYRYQPRRGNKGLPPRLTTVTGEDPGRCPKCGGRYIATPRTPLTPFVSPPGSAVKTPTSMGPPPYGRHGSDASDQYIRQNAQTPYRSDSISSRSGRPQWAGPGPSHGPLYDIHEDYEMASPSDAKRRRYNSAGSASSAGPYRPSYQSLPSPPTPFGGHEPRRQLPHRPSINGPPTPSYGAPQSAGPLPGPSAITRSGSNSDIGPGLGSMRPPPRPGSVSYATGAARGSTGGHSEFDESLRLPPLQTHLPNSPTSEASAIGPGIAAYSTALPPGHDYHSQREREREAHRRSVESMIMTIPYINKLQVLERISQPLPPPGTTGWIMSPGAEPSGGPRGPIIAIEGSNARLLQMVAPIIEKALLASGECDVRTWLPPSPSPEHPNPTTEDVPMRNASTTTSRSASVTSLSTPNTTATFTPYLQAMLDWHVRSSDMVRFVTTLPAPQTTIPSSSDPSSSSAAPPPAPRKAPLPVALLPAGFSLTTSDRFACTTPIADSYAPVDHWQWMATLWRGIAGADLTVYARTATEEELKRLQGVELKAPGLMVVRVDEREVTGGPMAEKTERRLGFEVVEWVRGGAFYHFWAQGGGGSGEGRV